MDSERGALRAYGRDDRMQTLQVLKRILLAFTLPFADILCSVSGFIPIFPGEALFAFLPFPYRLIPPKEDLCPVVRCRLPFALLPFWGAVSNVCQLEVLVGPLPDGSLTPASWPPARSDELSCSPPSLSLSYR